MRINSKKPLTILITNLTLAGYTGTEVAVRDLAFELKKLGHFPMIYTSQKGGVSQEIEEHEISVVTHLSLLPKIPDIIHGHHHIETLQALLHFPQTPAIFVCHDRYSWHDVPPKFNRIVKYIAVDNNCKERLIKDYYIDEKDIEVIYNWVDIKRYKYREFLSKTPRKALLFSNYAKANSYLEVVKKACDTIKLPLDVIGFGIGKGHVHPENVLNQYDLVFAKAKCAIEAMSTGAAVILCDMQGLGEMVTSNNVASFRAWNFGSRLLTNRLTEKNIISEIKKYNCKNVKKVTQFIRKQSDVRHSVGQYLDLYETILMQWQNNSAQDLIYNLNVYIKNLLNKIHLLEMAQEALPIDACKQLKLSWQYCPQVIEEKCSFFITISLSNSSMYKISSNFPSPIFFAYHWFYEKTNEPYLYESPRLPITPWLGAQMSADYNINIIAPNKKGSYRLVVTLVQENVRWFDELKPAIAISETVKVKSEKKPGKSKKGNFFIF